MKVSLKTVEYYLNGAVDTSNVDLLVAKIGQQLGAVEEVVDYGSRFEGIVVAKVVSCVKHENADKLSVCMIDDGNITQNVERNSDGLVQVVCGAPNVQEGLVVAWIPPGVAVPETVDKDPFVLESREIRGVKSNGMLASANELGISNDHSGILEIKAEDVREENTIPGTSFRLLYGLNDFIIDIENKMFTHRPDCFGIMGIAREIAGIHGQKFESPDWYWKIPHFEDANGLELEVDNQLKDFVPRFMAVALDNIQVGPSPIWMRALLNRVGIKPINNVVDLTNYYSYITAQPLHAYDYDKVVSLSEGNVAKLVVRFPKDGEQITLLNSKTIKPREQAIMIATDKELIGVGGVMGGSSTEVDDNTRRIILECANFDMYNIRKTSMTHGLFTDAVTRFNKGQSPLQNDRVIAEVMKQMSALAGGNQASKVIDDFEYDQKLFTDQTVHRPVRVTADFVNQRLGLSLTNEDIKTILRNVNFACLDIEETSEIEVYAPFFRTDISLPEDVVEEVCRLVGFDKMPTILPKKSVTPGIIDPKIKSKKIIRDKLASLGANEILTYSFVHSDLLKKSSQDESIAFKITNAISPDLQYYRLSLTPSILSQVHPNIKANYDSFALFEIGNAYSKTEIDENNVPKEFGRVALVVADKNSKTTGFYHARAYLDNLGLSGLKFQDFDMKMLDEHKLFAQMFSVYEPNRSSYITTSQGHPVGVIGEFKSSVVKSFKLPNHCAGFEIFLSCLKNFNKQYVQLSRFPSISQDLCLEVSRDLRYSEFETAINQKILDQTPEDYYVDQKLIDIFSDDSIIDKKRITIRLTITSYQRTLTENIVTEFVTKLADALTASIDARRI